MQVAFTPTTPAEARLLAAFIQDYADLLEQQVSQIPLPNFVVSEPAAAPALEKKSRPKKSAATAEQATESGSVETAAPVATEGNEAAPAATEPVASSEEPAGNTTAAEDSPAAASAPEEVSIDALRQVFGELSQAGKRDAAVKIVRSKGVNGLAEIKPEDRADVLAQFKGL